ncbi:MULTISPECIES: ATP-dependent helicase HrpB [Micromonospora]|uniref:ATP-dependent helicase HrpB n=1 Tax=Micromonospora solifontis TaxID=2487138 RepID=A0ABX9WJ98_9ACTN|nr:MULTISPECIES: ATP-dependent helicase HrpB [Micromonospora]NES15445.1 ATP-dependent helicase HrpB [Micromonospora sp. PPF5-17B]NES35809.1 ATP-dependent helicase HrpB [Micromonospora solifontis]NES55645.1 ATP-dependent helicase HrpB [Micromonospora sp. PPF5-6]RNM00287.1 ATP-dependent helicase HrpB [Micromonospora solifontis]
MLSDVPLDLPVRPVLPALVGALRTAGTAVLVAPPGTGKTTLAPLAVADEVGGRVVIAQPRRVAARAAARRMATLLGERVGGRVGYAVRGERRIGPDTRVEVVTTGLLVRRLHHDPELPGVGAVLLDECHERQLDADLALAFAVEARGALRPDLWLLAMSATPQADRFAALLGGAAGPAPVVRAEAALHPVTRIWTPPPRPVAAPGPGRVDPALLDHVAATVRRALRERDGDVLVFLPGAGEIGAVAGRLADLSGAVAVLPLHGRLPGAAQDAALRPQADRRRVVLATSVAESSLTVPGVRVVVDAGLSRVARTDLARGLGALVTVPVSRAAATQRAGRAGREAPGAVYRCWSEATHARLAPQPEPEIATADLTGFALELAAWGDPDGSGLALPDPPPPAALAVARETLTTLGAVDRDGRITTRGRAVAAAGTHPRLARALLDGARRVGADRAAEVVALLAEETLGGAGDDLTALWRRLRTATDPAATARWRAEVRRLRAALPTTRPGARDLAVAAPAQGTDAAERGPEARDRGTDLPDDLAAGLLVGLAYPERLARARRAGGSAYLMAGGTAAEVAAGSGLAGSAWLAVAVADRSPGAPAARVRLATPVDEATAREAGGPLLRTDREVGWSGDDVVAREVVRLGAIVLVDRPLAAPDPARLAEAVLAGLRRGGLELLTWTPAAIAVRQRLAFCRQALGDDWPDVADPALLDAAPTWLGPELGRARRRADLARIDVAAALRRLLDWRQAARLDELAPERLPVPSGSRVRVDYADPAAPVLAVKLQETFGWRDAPRIADGRVPVLLHLLSPAGRPVAVTADLASFWRTGYPQVRAELRGRYPRHPWPEDPTTAEPTRHATPRRR